MQREGQTHRQTGRNDKANNQFLPTFTFHHFANVPKEVKNFDRIILKSLGVVMVVVVVVVVVAAAVAASVAAAGIAVAVLYAVVVIKLVITEIM